MFCPNCGNQMEDDSKFCTACGARIEEEGKAAAPSRVPAVPSGNSYRAPVKPKKSRQMLVGLGAAAVLIVVILAAAMSLLGGSYKKPLNDLTALFNKESTDLEAYINAAFPSFVGDTYKECKSIMADTDEYEEAIDRIEDELIGEFIDLKDEYGDDAKVSYEILEQKELSKKELNQIRGRYKDMRSMLSYVQKGGRYYYAIENILTSAKLAKYDSMMEKLEDSLKEIEVTEGYRLDLSILVKGSKDDYETHVTVNSIKVNGKWCLDSGNVNLGSILSYLR